MKKIVDKEAEEISLDKIKDSDIIVVMNTDINKIVGFITTFNNVYVHQRSTITSDFDITLTSLTLRGVIDSINNRENLQCYKL
jgi:hypothetical protein